MKGINLQIQEFRDNLANVINESKIPITVKQMVLADATAHLTSIASQIIDAEQKAFEKEGDEVNGEEIP